MSQTDASVPLEEAPSRTRWTGGQIAALVGGVVLILVSLALMGAGGTAVWAEFQRDAGYVITGNHQFSSSGSALATESIDMGSAGVGWLYSPDLLGKVRIRVTPEGAGAPLFVGIGPSSAVDRYLAGVNRTVITDYWSDDVEDVAGGKPASAPGEQSFWVASDTGTGPRSLVWDPKGGKWTVVVMNASGRPGVAVNADLGARVPHLEWISVGLLVVGAFVLAGGVLLLVVAIRRRTST